jgi:hypothetical protein
VELHDPLTYPQVIAFQDAISDVVELLKDGEEPTLQRLHYALLPGLIPCVEKWDLESVPEFPTVDTFPAVPMLASGELIDWLRDEIQSLITQETTVPNE